MGRVRQYTQAPYDDAIGQQTKDWQDWVTTALNTLVGQNLSPQQGFTSLQNPTVDPTTGQIKSLGSRAASLTTGFTFTATTTSVTMYWDGTNSSVLLRIYRDDNSVDGPFSGNQLVTGLNPSTQYFFYPYFDETLRAVQFVTLSGVAVGSPPIAYTATMILAAQQQLLRGRIPLAGNLAITGITTPASGTTPATSLGGGGGSVGGYLGQKLK
jgi:hypothetical protein